MRLSLVHIMGLRLLLSRTLAQQCLNPLYFLGYVTWTMLTRVYTKRQ